MRGTRQPHRDCLHWSPAKHGLTLFRLPVGIALALLCSTAQAGLGKVPKASLTPPATVSVVLQSPTAASMPQSVQQQVPAHTKAVYQGAVPGRVTADEQATVQGSHSAAAPAKPLILASTANGGIRNSDPNSTGYQEPEGLKKAPVRLDPGEKRPEDQLQIDLFGRPLTIGGQYEIQPQYRKDAKLDPDERDDIASIDQTLKFELLYSATENITAFIQGTFFYEAEVYAENGEQEYARGFERQQSWLYFQNLFDTNISMQIGRQRFADKRQWWWNDQLDAIRFYWNQDNFAAELGFAEEAQVKRTDEDFIEPRHDDVFRVLGDVVWQWEEKQQLALFFLSQTDHSATEQQGQLVFNNQIDDRDADLVWVGGRAFGKFRLNPWAKFAYWLDSAVVFGRQTDLAFDELDDLRSRVDGVTKSDVLGWAVDTGATWFTSLPFEPYFTAGYARGSGDSDPNDGVDNTFRQSSLQGNKVKFGANQRFRWYGEAFRPELSNLDVWSVGMGLPLSEESAIDFVWHNYHQAHAAPFIRESRLRTDPNGINRHLGDEFDLIVSLDEWERTQFQLICAVFRAGDAFGELEGNTAATVLFKFNYSF